jgi:nicotinamidase/pyrazinamidase
MAKLGVDLQGDALVIVDIQYDFCPDGALAVRDGDLVIPTTNGLARRFGNVVLTQDWHPFGHLSFASSHPGTQPFESIGMPYGQQVLWPDHCVQGTHGAEFHRDLDVPHACMIIRKGIHSHIDSYSAFFENDRTTPTGLFGYLRERGIKRVFLCGLATDFCVQYSALDSCRAGFTTVVVEDACRAIDLEGSLSNAMSTMNQSGVMITKSDDIN